MLDIHDGMHSKKRKINPLNYDFKLKYRIP